MSPYWTDVLATLALQHLWQAAVLIALAWLLARLRPRLGADVHSGMLLCAFVLAVILPLAVLLPGHASSAPAPAATATPAVVPAQHSAVMQAHDMPASAAANWPAVLGTTFVGAWLLGFFWSMQRLIGSGLAARRLRDTARELPDAAHVFPHALPRGVVIRASDQISGPMVVGLVSPCILFPQQLIDTLPVATRLHILRHEIAHIRRHDLWAALLQSLCLCMYWWSPPLRLLGTQLDTAREMACDEHAAMQSPSVTDYADALLAGIGTTLAPPGAPRLLAAGIFTSRTALTQRIEGLLSMDIKHRISGNAPLAAACATVILASVTLTLLATPRMGLASPARSAATLTHGDDGAALIEAVEANRPDLIRQLVRQGADIDAAVDGDGTALLVAAKRGNLPIVHMLIGLGAKVDQPSPGDGNPLIAASAYGHLDVVQALVGAGADLNAIVPGDETPLINAARRGHLAIVKYLVDRGADVNLGMLADRGEWRSPLNQASNDTIRQYLVDKGASPHR